MSNIIYDTGVNIAIYESKLQEYINNILKKIGISDKEIKWVIFDEKKHLDNKKNINWAIPSFLNEKNFKYGFCYIDKKEIWISTTAIMKAPLLDYIVTLKPLFGGEKDNFLVDVILDELAHIVTKKGHGSEIYEKRLREFYQKYYGGVGISIL